MNREYDQIRASASTPDRWRTNNPVDPKVSPFVFLCNTPYSQSMQQKTVTFRAPGDKIKALDSLAALQQRDRSFVLNEAVDQYLSLNEYHIALIKEGIRQADTGELRPHEEVRRRLLSHTKPAAARESGKRA
jgi:RHH-type transcriptional regulator, rel operon repressor / antitoxin RelB